MKGKNKMAYFHNFYWTLCHIKEHCIHLFSKYIFQTIMMMLSLTMGDLIKDQELLKFLIDEAKRRMELSYDPRFPDLPVFLFFFPSNLAARNRQLLNSVLPWTDF